jgi:hypothetical protein
MARHLISGNAGRSASEQSRQESAVVLVVNQASNNLLRESGHVTAAAFVAPCPKKRREFSIVAGQNVTRVKPGQEFVWKAVATFEEKCKLVVVLRFRTKAELFE